MKKNLIASVLLMAVLLVSLPAHAEKQKEEVTVEQVMDKYIEAIGGKKAVAKIKDITMTQKIIKPDGESVLVTKQLNKRVSAGAGYYCNASGNSEREWINGKDVLSNGIVDNRAGLSDSGCYAGVGRRDNDKGEKSLSR